MARNAGYMFNYLVEERKKVDNIPSCSHWHVIGKPCVDAVKSSTEMTTKQTYLDKGFSSTIWEFNGGYPTLKNLSSGMYN